MSFLKKSLEKRILELRKSIEMQGTELAAYEQVLALESGKPFASLNSAPPVVAAAVKQHSHPSPARKASPVAAAPISVDFNGSRSDFVEAALKQRGAAGATPHEISAAFAARKIAVGKNLVYNVLSSMFKQKRVRRSGGKYYLMGSSASALPAGAPKKSRISEEGMRRIIAATKKRWAAKRAADSKAKAR